MIDNRQRESYICKRCGRKLKSLESQKLGMGYVCFQKYQQEHAKKKLIQSLQNNKDVV